MVADMTDKKKKLKNILRQIIMEYIQGHAVNSRIPSERDISAALDINRYSIRKHLAAFEREGWISKNGRQGMFLCSQAELRDTYGLITGDGSNYSYLDGPDMIAGVLHAFSEHNCIVRNLPFTSVSQIPQTVQRFGLKGVIWVEPSISEANECFNVLLEKEIPLVFCSNLEPDRFYRLGINSNFVASDCEAISRERAKFLAEHACRHAVCLVIPSKERDFILENLKKFGIESSFFSTANEFLKKMPELMQKNAIDGILCNGYSNFYQVVFQFLHDHPDFHPILSIEDHPKVRAQMKRYPGVRVDFGFEPWQNWLTRLGAMSVEMLLRAAENPIQPYELIVPQPIKTKNENRRSL